MNSRLFFYPREPFKPPVECGAPFTRPDYPPAPMGPLVTLTLHLPERSAERLRFLHATGQLRKLLGANVIRIEPSPPTDRECMPLATEQN